MGHEQHDHVAPAFRVTGVRVVHGGTTLLGPLDWSVARGAHAAVVGPNGAGKTTLLRLLAGYRHPTAGTVEVLGSTLGRIDVRSLRRRVGIVSDALERLIHRRTPLRALVAGGLHGVTAPTTRELARTSLERADAALEAVGLAGFGDRSGHEVSEGEWKRARLARALVLDPELLLLDEPCSGLDLAQRESFLDTLRTTLARPDGPTAVLVTHHLDEVLPDVVDRALLLRAGVAIADGPLADAVTSETLSTTFDVPVELHRLAGRLTAVPIDR